MASSSAMHNAKLPASVKRGFSSEVETDYDNLQPFFLESSDEENASFYDSSMAFPDSWRKFDLLTSSNGGSPVKKSDICEDVEDQPRNFASVGAVVQNVDISGFLKRMRTESLSLSQQKNFTGGSHAQLILRDDFMWSAPGLEALGFGSRSGSSSKVAEKQQQQHHHQQQPQEQQQCTASLDAATVHAKQSTCMDAVQVFLLAEPATKAMDCMDSDDSDLSDEDYDGSDGRSARVTLRNSVKAEVAADDDDTDEGEGDSDDDDDEEVDVVSLNKGQQQQELRFHTAATVTYRRRSAGDRSPCSAVITADVAAMHNYSNRSSAPLPTGPSAASLTQAAAGSKRPGCPLARSMSLLVKRPRLSAPSSPAPASEAPPSWRARHKASSVRHHHHGYHHHHHHHQASSPGGGGGRRELHNVLERKRRDDLRGNFNGLRDLLPNVQAKERMPKVTILRRSCDHIRSLRRSFHALSAEMQRLRQRQGELRSRLRQLGGDAAAMQMVCEDEDTAAAHWG